MKSNRVITHGGVTLNLASIKSFKVQTNINIGKTNILVIEHKKRYEFLEHPKAGEFIKQEFNETTEVEYPSYDSAVAHRDEWAEIWQEYLDEQC